MTGRPADIRAAALALVLMAALAGCAGPSTSAASTPTPASSSRSAAPPTTSPPTPDQPAPDQPTPDPTDAAEDLPSSLATPARQARIWLRIPAIGLQRLRVIAYRGSADDRPGTRIQDRGRAATPRGPRGGVGPGQVGNMVVTAHRTAAGRPFGALPALRAGQHVFVEAGDRVYDYRITRTMTISFRSPDGPARQSAPIPGRLGATATRPMITLSTCATPEDHAAGNFWSDALHNPEHRIDKVGVLVGTRSR
jgi:sortase A